MHVQVKSLCLLVSWFSLTYSIAINADDNSQQIQGEVSLTAASLNDDSYKFGEYSGISEDKAYLWLDFELVEYADWQTGDGKYWQLAGQQIGLDSEVLKFSMGQQSHYQVSFNYQSINQLAASGAESVYQSTNGTNFMLPSDWQAAENTQGFDLTGRLRPIKLEKSSEILALSYRLNFLNDWNFSSEFKQQNKSGQKALAATFGNTGGNPRAVFIAPSIDKTTRELNLFGEYVQQDYVIQLNYFLSVFNNQHADSVFQNPYSAITGWAPETGHPTGYGQMALAPDNRYQQARLAWVYYISPAQSLNSEIAFGRMTQDQAFLPYTINTALSVPLSLPQSSLDGLIDITLFKAGYDIKPTRRLSLDFDYRLEERDNKTPMAQYATIGGDSQNQNPSLDSSRQRWNIPYDLKEQIFKSNARYRFKNSHNLSLRYQWKQQKRRYAEVEKVKENKMEFTYSPKFSSDVSLSMNYRYAKREGDGYDGQALYLASHSSQYIDSLSAEVRFENHPLLRKYYLADRKRQGFRISTQYTPSSWFNLGWSGSYLADDYQQSIFGLNDSRVRQYNLDVGIYPNKSWALSLYADHEDYRSNQSGRSFRGFNLLVEANDPNRNWFTNNQDVVTSYGGNLRIETSIDRLSIELDALQSNAKGKIDTQVSLGLSAAEFPNINSRFKRWQTSLLFKQSEAIEWRLAWQHESLDRTDWQVDQLEMNTLNNVLLFAQEEADYNVDFFSVTLNWRF